VKRLGLLLALLVFATNAPADEWHFEVVDEGNWVGWKNALVLDSSGFPHIAYYDVGNNSLKYTHWDGSQWRVETVHYWGSDCIGGMGIACIGGIGIAMDSADRPRIAYRAPYEDGSALWYARWDGSQWRKEVVDHETEWGCGYGTCLKLDSMDRPRIAYAASIGGFIAKLKYAQWDGSAWRVETIEDTGNVGWSSSLELDSQERPHIAYRDTCFEALKYASWTGSSWQIEIVEEGRGVGFGVSLELDPDDHPHIAFVETHPNDEHDVKYAWWDGSQWHFDTVESGRDVANCISLALDSALRPHITYYDWDTSQLRYARWDGASWQIADLGMIFKYSCIVVDDEDQPHISCHSWPSPEGVAYLWHEGEFGVEEVELSAVPTDEGVVVGWSLEGDVPAGMRVLRGDVEPEAVSGNLPGGASRYLDRDVEPGGDYVYWLEVTEADGTVSRFGPTEAVTVSGELAELVLYAAYPNPSGEVVNFVFSLPSDGAVVLSVYDLAGRRVATLVAGELTAGRHEVSWDCAEVPSGVYVYSLVAGDDALTRRVVVTR
jgi:hypothetical protein